MNRFISNIFLLLLAQITFSQEYKHITLEFNPDDYSISSTARGGACIQTSPQEGIYLSDQNLPAIPYKIINVKVLGCQNYAGVTLTQAISRFAENVVLKHNPVSIPTNTIPSSSTPDTITYLRKTYPDKNVVYTGTSDYGNYKILSFLVSPWVYDARERTLELMTHMDLQIELLSNPLFTVSSIRDDYSLNEFTNALAFNANEFTNRLQSTGLRTLSSSDYEFIVITTNALSQYFMPLVSWKTKKGVKAKIITIEEIGSTNAYCDSTIQLSIKRCLYDYYNNHGLKYVLLGGDDTVVPVQGCYCVSSLSTDYHIPCDNFYACFSGHFAWNADGDSITGEYEDNVDFTPSIYISRAPVRSGNDVAAFVNKTLNYEKTPNINGWYNKMLMGGRRLLYEFNGISDSQLKGEALYDWFIHPYWNYNMLEFYDTGTDFNGGANYSFDPSHLQEQLAGGYTFVDLITHGDTVSYMTETSDNYTVEYASSLTNPIPTIITTAACTTNAFDSSTDPCLSESFIRNPNSNVVAYLGCSRETIESADSNLGPPLLYEGFFYERLFGSTIVNKNWGSIVANAKAYVASTSSYSSHCDFRWLQFSLNPIGDPEMPVFINPPITFGQSTISYTNSGFTVNAGVSGCRICIMSSDDNGASVYDVYDNVQSATVNSFNCNLSVCITKQGYIPKVYNMTPTFTYIQNATIETDTDYEACRIKVGTNVTNQIPSGNVVIQNCNVTIAADETTIYPTTEIKVGASLTITNR